MEQYRIENVEKIFMGNKYFKVFNAFEYNTELKAYIHIGQFSAPAEVPNKDLIYFIVYD